MTTKTTVILFAIVLGCCHTLRAQDSLATDNLVYAARHMELREFLVIQHDYKILATVQQGAQPLRLFLMSNENLLVDSLNSQYFFHVYPFGNQVLVTGMSYANVYRLHDQGLQLQRHLPFCQPLGFTESLVFYHNIYLVYGLPSARSKLPHVYIIPADTSQISCIDVQARGQLITGSRNLKLRQKLIYSLPTSCGIGRQTLSVFLRDAQELLLFDRHQQLTRYTLPADKEHVWHYLYDWQADKHYLIRAGHDNLELYLLGSEHAFFLQTIEHFPTQIVGGRMIYCAGSLRTNCDFYAADITGKPGRRTIKLSVSQETIAPR